MKSKNERIKLETKNNGKKLNEIYDIAFIFL